MDAPGEHEMQTRGVQGSGSWEDADRWPPQHSTKRMCGSPTPALRIEINKANQKLALGDAPDPDDVPAQLYRKMPTLSEVPAVAPNHVPRTGPISTSPPRIYLVPTLKPGKDPN